MSVTDDMRRAVAACRAERAGKRSLGFPEPTLVLFVGDRAWHGYAARRAMECGTDTPPDLTVFEGVPVEACGGIGVWAEWCNR